MTVRTSTRCLSLPVALLSTLAVLSAGCTSAPGPWRTRPDDVAARLPAVERDALPTRQHSRPRVDFADQAVPPSRTLLATFDQDIPLAPIPHLLDGVERETFLGDRSPVSSTFESTESQHLPQWADVSYLNLDRVTSEQPLSADQCLQDAAREAAIANLIEVESQLLACLRAQGCRDDEATEIARCLLSFRAQQERLRAADEALRLYLGLVEIQRQRNAIQSIADELEAAQRLEANVVESGIAIQLDPFVVPLQQTALRQQRVDLNKQQRQANSGLNKLLGRGPACAVRFVPVFDAPISPQLEDLESAIAEGCAARAELRSLRYLRCAADPEALPSMRRVLRGADAALGNLSNDVNCRLWTILFGKKRKCLETEFYYRQRQLDMLYEETLQGVATEIEVAYHELAGTLQRVAVRGDELDQRRRQVEYLAAKREGGDFDFDAVQNARLALRRAESESVSDVMDYHRALAKLQTAKGVLLVHVFPRGDY